jgi:uncharacterized protein (DUF58 family)
MAAFEMLDQELLAKIKGIQIRARHLVNDVFAGEYQSAFRGRGLEFEEVREYQAGDDIRSIDWNVTARQNKPYVKLYRDERELTVIFVVDVSASARFGSHEKFKDEIAAEITALLAYTALRNNDKVGLIIFSDHVEHYLPPRKGRGHIWRLIEEILTYKSTSRRTNINAPLDFLNRVIKRRAIAFLISDFQDEGYQTQLRATRRHHDLIAISIQDPRERELPSIGYIELEDAETGEAILVNTRSEKLRAELSARSRRKLGAEADFFRSCDIGYIPVDTSVPYIDPIARYFRLREKQKTKRIHV